MMQKILAILLCSTLGVGAPMTVFAQDATQQSDEYTALTQQASEAYEAGDYELAISLFKEAYAVKPVSNLLYNIGRVSEESGDIDSAIEYYDKFVVAPNVEQTARKDALERLKTLREVREMRDKVNEPQVAETPTPAPAPDPEPAAKAETSSTRTIGWVLVGVGGASLVGGGVFSLLTQQQFNNFESATTLEERQSAASAGSTNAVVADSLLVAGAVVGLTGIILVAVGGGSEKNDSKSTLRITPSVGPNGIGVGIGRAF